MLKIVGVIILVSAGTFIGFLKAKNLSNRVSFLEEYISLISYIETQVRYSSECITTILSSYENYEKLCFLNLCVDKTLSGDVFSSAWCESIANIPKDFGLKAEDISLLNDFGKGFGFSDVDGQIAHCKLHKQLLLDRLNDARTEKHKKYRLYQMLGASCGLCIALLCI